jgi:hypothetical protein
MSTLLFSPSVLTPDHSMRFKEKKHEILSETIDVRVALRARRRVGLRRIGAEE